MGKTDSTRASPSLSIRLFIHAASVAVIAQWIALHFFAAANLIAWISASWTVALTLGALEKEESDIAKIVIRRLALRDVETWKKKALTIGLVLTAGYCVFCPVLTIRCERRGRLTMETTDFKSTMTCPEVGREVVHPTLWRPAWRPVVRIEDRELKFAERVLDPLSENDFEYPKEAQPATAVLLSLRPKLSTNGVDIPPAEIEPIPLDARCPVNFCVRIPVLSDKKLPIPKNGLLIGRRSPSENTMRQREKIIVDGNADAPGTPTRYFARLPEGGTLRGELEYVFGDTKHCEAFHCSFEEREESVCILESAGDCR